MEINNPLHAFVILEICCRFILAIWIQLDIQEGYEEFLTCLLYLLDFIAMIVGFATFFGGADLSEYEDMRHLRNLICIMVWVKLGLLIFGCFHAIY